MSNSDNNRVMTLHPDEHAHIIIDRIGNVRHYLDNHVADEELGFVIDELESLRSYLRMQRLGEH